MIGWLVEFHKKLEAGDKTDNDDKECVDQEEDSDALQVHWQRTLFLKFVDCGSHWKNGTKSDPNLIGVTASTNSVEWSSDT